MNPLEYTVRMSKKNKRKKTIVKQALDSIRKPVPPPGHTHEMDVEYVRKPKHKKRLLDYFEDTYGNE